MGVFFARADSVPGPSIVRLRTQVLFTRNVAAEICKESPRLLGQFWRLMQTADASYSVETINHRPIAVSCLDTSTCAQFDEKVVMVPAYSRFVLASPAISTVFA